MSSKLLWQLLVLVDSVSVLEVTVGPGGSCHVGLAAPGDISCREKEKKERERRKDSFS
jgi:hypothetical protein